MKRMLHQHGGGEGDNVGSGEQEEPHIPLLISRDEMDEMKGTAPPTSSPTASLLSFSQSVLLAGVYMTSSVGYYLLIRRQKLHGVMYNPALLVLSLEFCKLCACVVAYQVEHGESLLSKVFLRRDSAKLWRTCAPYACPSFIYAVYNNLTYANLKLVDPATYQVFLQTKVLLSGLLFTVIFRQFLSLRQWCALVLVMLGVASKFAGNQRGTGTGTPTLTLTLTPTSGTALIFAFVMIFFQGFLSAFAGVFNEYCFKKDLGLSIHIQNFYMYFYALAFNTIIVFCSAESISAIDFSIVFQPTFQLIILCGATTGLAAAFLLKFINVIVKGFAAAMEVMVTAVAAHLLLKEALGAWDFFAALLVTFAMYVYYSKGLGDQYKIRFGLRGR